MDVQAWLTANWQPALVIAVIGLFLGWLITYLIMRGRRKAYEASISDLNTKVQSGEKALADARLTTDNLKAEASASQVRLNTAQSQITALQGDFDALKGQKDAVDASLMDRRKRARRTQGSLRPTAARRQCAPSPIR